jgi:hypothetical protein
MITVALEGQAVTMTVDTHGPTVFDLALPTIAYPDARTPTNATTSSGWLASRRRSRWARTGPAPWKPITGICGPTTLPIERELTGDCDEAS